MSVTYPQDIHTNRKYVWMDINEWVRRFEESRSMDDRRETYIRALLGENSSLSHAKTA